MLALEGDKHCSISERQRNLWARLYSKGRIFNRKQLARHQNYLTALRIKLAIEHVKVPSPNSWRGHIPKLTKIVVGGGHKMQGEGIGDPH